MEWSNVLRVIFECTQNDSLACRTSWLCDISIMVFRRKRESNHMKTVGILTFHRSRSYGASLQAYATLKALQKIGCDAEFIDYTNAFEQRMHKPRGNRLERLYRYIRWVIKSTLLRDAYWKQRAFGNIDSFYEGHISKQEYCNHHALMNAHYDVMLAGSDQIWNPEITNGLDTAFLLEFGQAKRRVAYASSMGSKAVNEETEDQFRRLIPAFDAIGVREAFVREQLSPFTDKEIAVVCDPTFLLQRCDWDSVADSVEVRRITKLPRYALSYFVSGYTKHNMELAASAKMLSDVPLCNIHMNRYRRRGIDRMLAGITCPEFLALIKNAEYVITDSFHGIVFSIVFEKSFIPLTNQKNPVRVRELMHALGLEDRIDDSQALQQAIDYDVVRARVAEMRDKGLSWLEDALR